jgi:hypothetical protein
VDETGWLALLKEMLTTAATLADRMVHRRSSIVLQEDDSSDRVCIVASLVQLLLDPFYRTIAGFTQLLQKEWISAGFPLSTSLGHLRENPGSVPSSADAPGEGASLQLFLDAVFQLLRVNPCAFEFTSELLSFISDHAASGLFGTFVGDSDKERALLHTAERTASLWVYLEQMLLKQPDEPVRNPLFSLAQTCAARPGPARADA